MSENYEAAFMRNGPLEETCLLANLMTFPERWPDFQACRGDFNAGMFTLPHYGVLFSAIEQAMAKRPTDARGALDVTELTNLCARLGDDNVTPRWLLNIIQAGAVGNSRDTADLVGNLLDLHVRRTGSKDFGEMARELVTNAAVDFETLATGITQRLGDSLAKVGSRDEDDDFIYLWSQLADEVAQRKEPPAPVSSGFEILDQSFGKLQRGAFVIMAARPGVGKTTFALNMVCNLMQSRKQKHPVLFFSVEMTAREITAKLLQQIFQLTDAKLRDPGAWERSRVLAFKETCDLYLTLGFSPLFIPETISSVGKISSYARKAALRYGGVQMIVIDYLQLLSSGQRTENRVLEVAAISRALKLLAQELDCPIIALSQLNRSSEKDKRKAMNSDLRDSGAIEQDADMIFMLEKAEGRGQDDEMAPVADVDGTATVETRTLRCSKNRHGPVGKLDFDFFPALSTFREREAKTDVRPVVTTYWQ